VQGRRRISPWREEGPAAKLEPVRALPSAEGGVAELEHRRPALELTEGLDLVTNSLETREKARSRGGKRTGVRRRRRSRADWRAASASSSPPPSARCSGSCTLPPSARPRRPFLVRGTIALLAKLTPCAPPLAVQLQANNQHPVDGRRAPRQQ